MATSFVGCDFFVEHRSQFSAAKTGGWARQSKMARHTIYGSDQIEEKIRDCFGVGRATSRLGSRPVKTEFRKKTRKPSLVVLESLGTKFCEESVEDEVSGDVVHGLA